jgi:uncharacterized membrane protein YeaQ/YmgE (transglycosylase-associated protein family)
MTTNSPLTRELAPAEEPTSRAELEIRVGYAEPPDPVRRRISPDQANYMTMTCGVLGSVVTGTVGAILTLRVAPERTGLALAQLMVALAGAGVITTGRRFRETAGHKAAHGRRIFAAGSRRAQPGSGAVAGSTSG